MDDTQPVENKSQAPTVPAPCPVCGHSYNPTPQIQGSQKVNESPQLDLFLPKYIREQGF